MNIVVDSGNTKSKLGIFEDDELIGMDFISKPEELEAFLFGYKAENIIVSSVGLPGEKILSWSRATGRKILLTADLPLPIQITYETPGTLGVDRIAAVCGAQAIFPGLDCLVIDAGTCITYEFLDKNGNYHGGGISPGVNMRFEAMHRYTARLPLVKAQHPVNLIGTSTETSLQSGVINGIRAEVNGIIKQYKKEYPQIKVLLCGGDAPVFANKLNNSIFVVPELVLIGLNKIMKHVLSH